MSLPLPGKIPPIDPVVHDFLGQVLRAEWGDVYSNAIIKNAIIEANPYIQIFGENVTLVNCKAREFSTAWFGAKKTNPDNSVQLQSAINACLSNGVKNLFVADSYTYSQSLKVCYLYNGYYIGVNLNIYGEGDMWSDKTTLTYTGNSFAIGYQMAKGGSISRLRIIGTYVPPAYTGASYYSTPFPVKSGHSGIVIDYDGSKNNGGSTALKVHDIWVDSFDVLYNVSPNGVTFNADCLSFTNIRCGSGRIGFQSGQAQEKGNIINNIVSWSNLHTLISIGKSGKYQAGQYIVRNGNVAGACVQLFDVSCAGWNSFAVDGLTVESIARIGTIHAVTSAYAPSVNLDKLYVRFALKSQAGIQTLLSCNSGTVRISNSNLWYYGTSGEVMKFEGPMTFDNCNFGLSTWINNNALNIKYTNPITYLKTQ
jgi:hypothetical protein